MNLFGLALVTPFHEAINPTSLMVWPGASELFQLALVIGTRKPFCSLIEFQAKEITCPLANVKRRSQLEIGTDPVF